MPYAPGIQYRGDLYLSQIGPKMAENVQNFLRNREERQQSTATAEMLGRYLQDDKHAMEMFGDKFADIDKMGTGQLKGFIGGVSTYMAQKHMQAQEQAQQEATKLARDQYQLLAEKSAREKASDDRMARFNQLINPPLMSIDAAGPRPTLTPEILTRYAAQAGVLGEPGATSLINTAGSLQERSAQIQGKAADQARWTAFNQLVNQSGDLSPDTIAKYAAQTGVLGESGVSSLLTAATSLAKSKEEVAPKLSEGDKTFRNLAPEYSRLLDEYEGLVSKYGNRESEWFGNPDAAARLKALPYQLAITYAKIVDPSSVAREGEVAAAQKYLIPSGWFTPNSVTIAAIKGQREDLANRMKTWQENTGASLPANMPASTTPLTEMKSADEIRAAYQAGRLTADQAARIILERFGGQSKPSAKK